MSGPLAGIRVIELAAIGPAPFAAMMLSDLGAEILRIDRVDSVEFSSDDDARHSVVNRGRRSVAVDLKSPEGVETVLTLIEKADILIEGYRPGVTERLGLGPDVCQSRNPKLVYARMTGWGQDGPLANVPGHDINYISLSGVLDAIGTKDGPPVPPLNLVGDYGGGGMLLALGVVAGVIEARNSGRGQVVDVSMVDGSAALMAVMFGFLERGLWSGERGENFLGGAAPFYGVYECADGGYVSIGSLEPQFYAALLKELGLQDEFSIDDQMNRSSWVSLRARMDAIFRTRTRDDWTSRLEGTDVCFAPVLSLREAPNHPHNRDRGTFVEVDGVIQHRPVPRFSRTPLTLSLGPPVPGEHTDAALSEWGIAPQLIKDLRAHGAIL